MPKPKLKRGNVPLWNSSDDAIRLTFVISGKTIKFSNKTHMGHVLY